MRLESRPPTEDSNQATDRLAEEILRYLEIHPNAVDSVRGIVSWWLQNVECEVAQVERTLERLSNDGLIKRIALADGTVVYGNPGPRAPK